MIKKLLSVIMCCTVFCTAKSQITKGNWMVGGSGNFNTSNQSVSGSSGSISTNNFSIQPNIGYFIIDKLAIGLTPGIQWNQTKGSSSITTSTSSATSYHVGPFVRYYLLNADKHTNIFLQGDCSYGINSFNNSGYKSQNSYFSYSIVGGPVVYFNSSVGIEFTLGWKYYKYINDDTHNGSFNFGIGFQIHLDK